MTQTYFGRAPVGNGQLPVGLSADLSPGVAAVEGLAVFGAGASDLASVPVADFFTVGLAGAASSTLTVACFAALLTDDFAAFFGTTASALATGSDFLAAVAFSATLAGAFSSAEATALATFFTAATLVTALFDTGFAAAFLGAAVLTTGASFDEATFFEASDLAGALALAGLAAGTLLGVVLGDGSLRAGFLATGFLTSATTSLTTAGFTLLAAFFAAGVATDFCAAAFFTSAFAAPVSWLEVAAAFAAVFLATGWVADAGFFAGVAM